MIKNLINIISGYILLGFDKYVGPWIESLMLVFTIPQPKDKSKHMSELLDDDEVADYLTYIIDEEEDDTRKPPFVQEENGFV